jgi:hypothetical protein
VAAVLVEIFRAFCLWLYNEELITYFIFFNMFDILFINLFRS